MSMTHEQYMAEERAHAESIRGHISAAEGTLEDWDPEDGSRATLEYAKAHALIAIAKLLQSIDGELFGISAALPER